jgi:diguanylate cyclase (GGDEF)-like protein
MIEGEKAFNEAVQRVRGYLFLVNVVLAADSYEMRFLSDQLAQQMQQSVNQSQASSLDTIEALNLKLLILGMLFLGATIVISYTVGRSIVHPIAYLRHIFERLAKGERDLTVVEYRTKDEVAALARSAEAFRRTNVHTQELLDKYQELSAELEDKVEARTAELEQANKRLAELSITDGLTGLFNRRHLDTTLAKNWAMARRSKLPLTVIMTDIDYFKKYNDLYGHQQGDSCLQEIARAMKGVFSRSTDFVARYGGEEFVVVLMDTHLNEAKQLAEELRERIEAHNIEHKDSPEGHVTLSIGLASFEPDCDIDNVDRLVGLADDALYQSKESGRNRVSVIGVELK